MRSPSNKNNLFNASNNAKHYGSLEAHKKVWVKENVTRFNILAAVQQL